MNRFLRPSTLSLFLLCLVASFSAGGQTVSPTPEKNLAADNEIKFYSVADRFYRTGKMATTLFQIGDKKQAAFYAEDLLKQAETMKTDWYYGNAIHLANLVLGRVALANGDMDAARGYLTKAGQTPGSPQLNNFGPDMAFAREMLAKGEKQAVLDYLKLCSKFWARDNGQLADWTAIIESGGKPNYGPNLIYFFPTNGSD
ncbi:hypothetical protein BH10ACI2_BH10ACI2_13520 [soil metagenome]